MKLFIFILFVSNITFANEKMREVRSDAKRAAKNASREVEDKTCELINGKMQCTLKKAKHSIEKSSDEIEDAAD